MSDPRKPRDPAGLPIPLPDADECPPQLRERIEGYFAGTLDDGQVTALFAELRESPAGQQAYNEAALVARLEEGGPEQLATPSGAELRGVEQAVLERVRLDPDAQPSRSPSRLLAWLGGLVAVGAAVLIALPFFRAADAPPTSGVESGSEFQARGKPARYGKQVGLRVFCLAPKGGVVRELRHEAAQPAPNCPLGSSFKFATTNRTQLGYLFLVGVDARRQALWYSPAPPRTKSVSIEKNTVDTPLEREVRLEVNHRRGELRIFAIFSSRPLAAKMVQKAITSSAKTPLSTLKILPMDDTEQRSLLIELR